MKTIALTLLFLAASPSLSGYAFPPHQGEQQADSLPEAIVSPAARYTEAARKNKIAGTVVLMIQVRADGSVDPAIAVVRGLGYGLDESAVETVRGWKYKPAILDGKPVDAIINVDVLFRLL